MATVIQSIAPASSESSSSNTPARSNQTPLARAVSRTLERLEEHHQLAEAALALLPSNTDSDQASAVLRALLQEIVATSNLLFEHLPSEGEGAQSELDRFESIAGSVVDLLNQPPQGDRAARECDMALTDTMRIDIARRAAYGLSCLMSAVQTQLRDTEEVAAWEMAHRAEHLSNLVICASDELETLESISTQYIELYSRDEWEARQAEFKQGQAA